MFTITLKIVNASMGTGHACMAGAPCQHHHGRMFIDYLGPGVEWDISLAFAPL